jgi:hypothetical protein
MDFLWTRMFMNKNLLGEWAKRDFNYYQLKYCIFAGILGFTASGRSKCCIRLQVSSFPFQIEVGLPFVRRPDPGRTEAGPTFPTRDA